MKKFIILPLVAVAALGLAACKPTATENASATNEIALNSDEAIVDSNVTVDETTLNGTDENAVAPEAAENASNATAK
ncbi:MAG: hypothetical protein JWN66_5014 [Sphingomonas bacterium]|uniref:hypothetical protein n=1 Tax=Sphingomonas bacterium TaxID=1895847 RepID=UPI00260C56AD|nr:hypothetical protein [Sphingomonas bacterium]MDB5707898.1 hypothetical protein [Sphingomonas bacterium]